MRAKVLVYSVQTGVQKIGNIIRYLSALPPKPIVHVHLEIIEFVRVLSLYSIF